MERNVRPHFKPIARKVRRESVPNRAIGVLDLRASVTMHHRHASIHRTATLRWASKSSGERRTLHGDMSGLHRHSLWSALL